MGSLLLLLRDGRGYLIAVYFYLSADAAYGTLYRFLLPHRQQVWVADRASPGFITHPLRFTAWLDMASATLRPNLTGSLLYFLIVDPVKYNEQNYSRTPLVGGQWVKGKKWPWEIIITYNKEYPQIPTAGKTVPLGK